MVDNVYVSDVYYMEPSDVVFSEIATFNPLHSELSFESTKLSMIATGQMDPIFMITDSFGKKTSPDGRHRTKICQELGIKVKCIDINPNIDPVTLFRLCNKNTTSGRDFTASQRAIQALRFKRMNNSITSIEAAKMFKVDKRIVSYAATISGYGYDSMLMQILNGESISIEGLARPTSNIEIICRQLKKMKEINVVENVEERIKWEPEALIKTEAGKQWFYDQAEKSPEIKVSHHLIASFIELANHKFKRVGSHNEKL
jgi:hypothetical protein